MASINATWITEQSGNMAQTALQSFSNVGGLLFPEVTDGKDILENTCDYPYEDGLNFSLANGYAKYTNNALFNTNDFSIILLVKSDEMTSNTFLGKYIDANNNFVVKTSAADYLEVDSTIAGTQIVNGIDDTALTENTNLVLFFTNDVSEKTLKMYSNNVLLDTTVYSDAGDLSLATDLILNGYNTDRGFGYIKFLGFATEVFELSDIKKITAYINRIGV